MKKFADFILKNRLFIIITVVILLALSVVGFLYTKTNGDLTTYLSDSSAAKRGYATLNRIFGVTGDASVALTDMPREKVDEVVEYLKNYSYESDGQVNYLFGQVIYIGNFDRMDNPSLLPFYKDGYALAKDKFFVETTDKDGTVHQTYVIFMYLNVINTDDNAMDAIDNVEAYLNKFTAENGGEFCLGGSATNSRNMLKSSIGEIPAYLAVAVAILLVVLLITTKSFLEPIVYILTLGIAIVLNVGSNIIMGSVSSITLASSTILQLALSMDYAIFLTHTYYEAKKTVPDAKDAMRIALPKTILSVSASAVTTIGGFIALMFMKYKIGLDLGVCLAKGVLLSLLSVIFIQPALITWLDKALKKTEHKFFTPSLKRIGGFSVKSRWVFLGMALALVVPCFIAQFYTPLGYLTTKKDTTAKNLSEEVLSRASNQLIVVVPMEIVDGQVNVSQGYAYTEEFKNMDNVTSVFSFFTLISEEDYTKNSFARSVSDMALAEQMFRYQDEQGNIVKYAEYKNDKEKYVRAYAMTTITIEGEVETPSTYEVVKNILRMSEDVKDLGGFYITGTAISAYELAEITPKDFNLVTVLSAVLIFAVLIIAFRDFLLSASLLLIIELGIWINLSLVALPYLLSVWFPSLDIGYEKINFMAYIIISSIQLGANVDYAILITSKFKESVKTMPLKDAISDAVKRGSASVIVSAGILIGVCAAVNLVTGNLIVAQITKLIARGSLISCVFVVTLLPAVLYLISKKKYEKNSSVQSGNVVEKTVSNEVALVSESPVVEEKTENETPET